MAGDERTTFGRWLKQQRHTHDLSQEMLAEQIGCAPSTLQKIEQGARRPSRTMAERIVAVLAVPPAEQAPLLRLARSSGAPGDADHSVPDGLPSSQTRAGAENRLWRRSVGALPAEQYVQLPQLNTRVRLLEYGHGPTLLFVHGGPNAASKWIPLVRLLPEFRCVLLERPGCGLSELPPAPPHAVRPYMVQVIQDTLAALDGEPAAIVASSFGSFAALAFAVAHPSRLTPMVHMGCPALVPGARLPLPFLLPLIPVLGALVRKLEPATLATSQRSFRRMGHLATFVQRPDIAELLGWYTSLTRDTPTRTNDQAFFARIRPRDALASAELARLQMPMSFFWGEADTFGGATVARALAESMPHARLELVAQSGHLPWLDAPERAAAHVRSFLAI